MNELLYAAIGFLLARAWYTGRLAWYRHKKEELESALLHATEELDNLEVKRGIREPDWDLDDWVEDGEEWTPYRLPKERNEA